MNHNFLREKFLKFFQDKEHTIFKSFSLIPIGDPTLLFTSAGMVPFKDYFIGKKKGLKRAATSQKCLRTGDIESVGITPFHHTFFEMLGNFSFGDYFKKEAIYWGWEFLINQLNLDKNRIYVSVYREDEESYHIWQSLAIPANKIYRLDVNTNFWPANAPQAGPNGPCGPCSEIYYDRGEKFCPKKEKCELVVCEGLGNQKCYRCVEVWNLVFTQYNRVDVNKLEPLPAKNIDTGMGLERLLCIYEGVDTNFDTSLFNDALNFISYEIGNKNEFAIRRILDHVRAVCFAIGEGIIPSNVGRGYVIRKLLRRAMISSYFLLNYYKPYIYKLAPIFARQYQDVYSELTDNLEKIDLYIHNEEEKFASQIEDFIKIINSIFERSAYISGRDIFELYDTYGIPLDLIKELGRIKNKVIDEEGFRELLEQQRARSRARSKLVTDVFITEGGIT
ncbi:MAG: alanine--tRNA ligase, partial [Planctomycetota bacterium]